MPADPAQPTLEQQLAWVDLHSAEYRKLLDRWPEGVLLPDRDEAVRRLASAEAVAALLRREMERSAAPNGRCESCREPLGDDYVTGGEDADLCRRCYDELRKEGT